MIRLLTSLLMFLAVTGCSTQTREQSHMVVQGMLNGQPVQLEVQGGTATVARTGVDPAQVQALIAKAVDAAVAEVAGKIPGASTIAEIARTVIGPAPAPAGFLESNAGGLIAAAGAGALALSKTLEARYHKRDAAEGWDRAVGPAPKETKA